MKKHSDALLNAGKRSFSDKKDGSFSHVKSETYRRGAKCVSGNNSPVKERRSSSTRYKKRKHAGIHWYLSLFALSARWYAELIFNKAPKGGYPVKRYSPERAVIMKKRYIAAITTVIIVMTFVLSVSLFGSGNNVYASGTGLQQAVEPTLSSSPDSSEYSLQAAEATEQTNTDGEISEDITSEPPAITDTPSPSEAAQSGLNPGCTDPKIAEIQTRLMDLGYMDSDQPTEYYGWGTMYAIELFQRRNGLQIDGLIGEKTMAMLFDATAQAYAIKEGDYGSDVKEIQERLKELKYFKSDATGHYGADTAAAIKSFQKTNGLKADGKANEDTREALFSDDAKSAPVKKTAKPKPTTTKTTKPADKPSKTTKPEEDSPAPSDSTSDDESNSTQIDKFISIAKSFLGSKYIRGAKGPNSFDCSGFVYYCLNKAGYKINYMVSTDWARCSLPKVSKMSDMKAGDIICYSPHHVAIYIGGGEMVDASSANGKVVRRTCETSYWKSHFICARRVF